MSQLLWLSGNALTNSSFIVCLSPVFYSEGGVAQGFFLKYQDKSSKGVSINATFSE